MSGFAQDFRLAFRTLGKTPWFTAVAALSIALGIGANTAIFSLIDAVMWRMLPVRDPAALWVIGDGMTFQQYRAVRDHAGVPQVAAFSPVRLNVSIGGSVEPTVDGQLVSGNYFSVLGVSPAIGRTIGAEDDRVPNGHPVAMISYRYWKRRFGLAPSVLGSGISISGTPFTVIGVAPAEFFGVEVGMAPDVFIPVMMQPAVMPAVENLLENPIIYKTWLTAIGRLPPGVSSAQAAAALDAVWREELPAGGKGPAFEMPKLVLTSAATGISGLRRQFSQPLFVLMALVGLVLLIACANIANLLLARAAARRAEFAMRLALGAGRGRLIRQLLAEGVVLGALGGVGGILLARWAIRLLVVYMSSGRSPITLDLNPNPIILGFTAAISIGAGILFGLIPALRATRIDPWFALKNAGGALNRGAGGLRPGKFLAVVQVALSLVLLVAAGLFVQSLQKRSGESFGTSRDSVLIVRVEPKGSDQRNISGTTARLDRTYRELLQRVEAIPGVRAAGLSQTTPTNPDTTIAGMVTLASGQSLRVPMVMLYPRYFAAIGLPMAAGREFTEDDLAQNAPAVCVVNETFARMVYAGANPLGRPCTTMRRPSVSAVEGARNLQQEYRIVGVVKDSRYSNPRGEARPMIYSTFLQTGTGRGQMVLHVRVAGDAGLVAPRIREEILRIDATLPVFDVHTLEQEMGAALIQERLIAMLSSLFSTLALVLASVGLYGLLAFAVVQRTAEMGIRMAVGAQQADVVRMIMREALVMVGLGVAIGTPAAWGAARLVASRVEGVDVANPVPVVAAVLVLAAMAAVASYVPARRASRVDPMSALRNE